LFHFKLISNCKFQISNLAVWLALWFVILISPGFVFASATDGTVSGYAWSPQIGWVNFGISGYSTVRITDSAVTGWAWNENTGRINLAPSQGGIANNGEGTLSGRAWSEGIGWIDFSGVTVNSVGVFSGAAVGDNDVTIYFSCGGKCSVSTDWRPRSSRASGFSSSGALLVPAGPFGILINNGQNYTNKSLVNLKLRAGLNIKRMAISNSSDFEGAGQENYQTEKKWQLSSGDGKKTVYVKFYTEYGLPSQTFQASIVLDTTPPEVKITSIKRKYSFEEEVILAGTSEPGSDVIVLLDQRYGLFETDEKGEWFITLGKLPIGSYYVEFYGKDLAGNIGKTVFADFLVEQVKAVPAPLWDPILRKLEQGIKPLVPYFFQPAEKPVPKAVVTVPKIPPIVLQGKWLLLPEGPITRLVLAPLPQDIKLLAQKFPQLGKTFSQVGVEKITDVQKIKNTALNLPTLNQAIGVEPIRLSSGEVSIAKAIPVASLSASAKQKIPSEIVFVKAGAGLIDFKVALTVNNQGKAEKRIKTIAGQPLQLVIRTEGKARNVKGYIVFKSKKPQESLLQNSHFLVISDFFSEPNFAAASSLASLTPLREATPSGARGSDEATIIIERKLVLAEFEYEHAGSEVYTATVNMPVVDGEYEILTVIDYGGEYEIQKQISLVTVVDPEGYIYEKSGNKETRIVGAVVQLFWLNPETKQYQLWPAQDYQQENPQTTNISGSYSFLVPYGYYYLKVVAPGYLTYDGKPFQVAEGSGIHINIELKTKFWFLNIVDWKTLLLIIVVLMLAYNFYKDRRREAALIKK